MDLYNKVPVIIDCDPGADDIFALTRWLIMHKKWVIDIKAITTSGGNVAADMTYTNALKAVAMMWLDIPVGKGQDTPGAEHADHIHGKDGLGNLAGMLPDVDTSSPLNSEQLLIDLINTHQGDLSVLVIGPATNMARIEKKQPGILKKTKNIISMGGAYFVPGNVSPVGEFNVWYDPDSAKIMYDSWANIIAAPLDITTTTLFGTDDLQPILGHINNEQYRKFFAKLTDFTIGTNMMFRETHYAKGFHIHDAHTIGVLCYPHLYTGSFFHVDVETQGEFTRGMTVVDTRNHPHTQNVNTYVITHVDREGFLEAMTEDFKEFDFGG